MLTNRLKDESNSELQINILKLKLETKYSFEEESDELKYNEIYSAPKTYKPGLLTSLSRNAMLSLMG